MMKAITKTCIRSYKIFLKFIFFIPSIIVSICGLVLSTNLECKYTKIYFHITGSTYSCQIINKLNIVTPESAFIESVTGTHLAGKSNDDVLALYVDVSKNIEYLPQGFERIFPNIKVIWIQNNNIKELKQSDLRPFPKLEYLKLVANRINVLEDGVFDFNQQLKGLCFERNKMYHIGQKVFDSLPKLTHLSLLINKCIDMEARNDAAKVRAVIEVAKQKCQEPELLRLKEQLSALETEMETLTQGNYPQFITKVENLENKFKQSKFAGLFELLERFKALKTEKYDLDLNDSASSIVTNVLSTSCLSCCEDPDLKNKINGVYQKLAAVAGKLDKLMSSMRIA